MEFQNSELYKNQWRQFLNITNFKIICVMQNNDNIIITFLQLFFKYNDSIDFKKNLIEF